MHGASGTSSSNHPSPAPHDAVTGSSPPAVAPPRAPGGTRGKGARIGIVLVVALGVGFLGLLGVRVKQATARKDAVAAQRAAAQEQVKKKEPAKVLRPTAMRWMPRVDFLGTLKPWREADIGFETPGRLTRVNVSMGDKVAAGQVLAVLDASRAAAQVGQAESQVSAMEANLALANDNLRRTEALAATKSVPEAQVEQARQQVALAKAQLDGAHASARFAKTGAALQSVSAPFPGVVTRAPTGIGSVVVAGAPLFRVEDTSRFRLSTTIAEEDVPLVSIGANVKLMYRERILDGKVIALVPSLDQATRRAPVEIEVPQTPDNPVLAWSFVRARVFGTSEIDAFRLPAEARKPGSQDEVVKVDHGKAKILKVSFVAEDDGSLVVQHGVTAGDEILLSPSPELKDGDPVDVAR